MYTFVSNERLPVPRAYAHKYVVVVASAILYFEYCLTFSREVDWVWYSKPRITWTHVLFYLNRYLPLFGHFVFLLQVLWISQDHPNKFRYFSVLVQTIVGVFLMVRTYALYNGNKKVQFLLFVCAAGALTVGVWSVSSEERSIALFNQEEDLVKIQGCFLPQKADSGRRKHLTPSCSLVPRILNNSILNQVLRPLGEGFSRSIC
ncbi:hypothetical protein H1R20_g10950, partial [Candolleomyces eurysporus]